jgi:N-acyl-D-amino-acid deacylase
MGAKHTEVADRAQCEAPHRVAQAGNACGCAHCSMICDASYPTFLLTHWARDRHRGKQLPLEYVIRKQSYDTAALFELNDRGVIGVGKRADVNVIDMDALTLHAPRMAYDLPAGGHRLVQGSSGYSATIVNGVVTRRGAGRRVLPRLTSRPSPAAEAQSAR